MATKSLADQERELREKSAAVAMFREELRRIKKEELASSPLSVAAVSAILDKDAKTLYNARVTRKEMLEEEKVIPPLDLASIGFVGTPNRATYMALDLVEYLNRLAFAPTLQARDQLLPQSFPSLKLPRFFLGFQSWLAQGDSNDRWLFSIRSDGRPIDLIAAILNKEVGDDVRWLTIREFGEMTADCADRASAIRVKAELESDQTTVVVVTASKIGDRQDRWEKPGGPM